MNIKNDGKEKYQSFSCEEENTFHVNLNACIDYNFWCYGKNEEEVVENVLLSLVKIKSVIERRIDEIQAMIKNIKVIEDD